MKVILAVLILVSLTACASKKDKLAVEKEVQASSISNKQAFGQTINDLIANSTTLTDSQKKELEGIIAANKALAESLTEKSFQYRSVLVKNLLSNRVNQNEIKILKRSIKKVEADKLKNTFETIEKISNIVSKNSSRNEFTSHMINMGGTFR